MAPQKSFNFFKQWGIRCSPPSLPLAQNTRKLHHSFTFPSWKPQLFGILRMKFTLSYFTDAPTSSQSHSFRLTKIDKSLVWVRKEERSVGKIHEWKEISPSLNVWVSEEIFSCRHFFLRNGPKTFIFFAKNSTILCLLSPLIFAN